MTRSILPRAGRAAAISLLAVAVAGGASAQDTGQDAGDPASPQVTQAYYAGSPFFKVVLTDDQTKTFPGPADAVYQDLPGAGSEAGAGALIAGPGTLVDVRFTAESQCSAGGSDPGWCGVRILVDDVEALPTGDFALDSTNNGADGYASWEGHALERHLCVPNPTGGVRFAPVQVQWRVFSEDGDATPPGFRLDEMSLTVESAVANCTPPVKSP